MALRFYCFSTRYPGRLFDEDQNARRVKQDFAVDIDEVILPTCAEAPRLFPS
jgi:hypothetical protein